MNAATVNASETTRAKTYCRQVVNFMAHMRGWNHHRLPREVLDDIMGELGGAKDPAISDLYTRSFARGDEPRWVAGTIQRMIWDR